MIDLKLQDLTLKGLFSKLRVVPDLPRSVSRQEHLSRGAFISLGPAIQGPSLYGDPRTGLPDGGDLRHLMCEGEIGSIQPVEQLGGGYYWVVRDRQFIASVRLGPAEDDIMEQIYKRIEEG